MAVEDDYATFGTGDVFKDGVTEVQPDVTRLVAQRRIIRNENGGVTLLHMDDILEVTKRRDVHSMDPGTIEMASHFMGTGRPLIPLMLDGEAHTKYRRLLDPLFAPKVVAKLDARVRELSNELIDAFAADGNVELFKAWCEPLPCKIFLSLLGLPLDKIDFLIWFKDGIIRPHDDTHREKANAQMIEYLYSEIDQRLADGTPGDDLISGFLTAEVDGQTITRDDVVDITFLLVLAGLDTVSASLSCMVDWFARHPDRRQQVIDDPSLLPHAIEELMRFETPVVGGSRHATADFELGGEKICAGDNISVVWAAANLDGEAFEDPLEVRFDRTGNRHIAFASGFHRCLGSHLARMEMKAALETLHERIPDYAIDPAATPGYNNVAIRNVDPLPLVFTPR